jgi:hypothetical protein
VVALDRGECGLREGSIKRSGAGGECRLAITAPESLHRDHWRVYEVLQQGGLGHVRAYVLWVDDLCPVGG